MHTYIIDDPFDDPKGLVIPDHSPERLVPEEEVVSQGLTKEDLVDKDKGKSEAELDKERKRLEAQSRAVVLEMIGDLPDADVKPPENPPTVNVGAPKRDGMANHTYLFSVTFTVNLVALEFANDFVNPSIKLLLISVGILATP